MSPKLQKTCVLIFYFFLDIFFFVSASKSFAEDATKVTVNCNKATNSCLIETEGLFKSKTKSIPVNYKKTLTLANSNGFSLCRMIQIPVVCQEQDNLYITSSSGREFVTKVFYNSTFNKNLHTSLEEFSSGYRNCLNFQIDNQNKQLYGYFYLFIGLILLMRAINSVFSGFSDLGEQNAFSMSHESLLFLVVCIFAAGTMFSIAHFSFSKIHFNPCF